MQAPKRRKLKEDIEYIPSDEESEPSDEDEMDEEEDEPFVDAEESLDESYEDEQPKKKGRGKGKGKAHPAKKTAPSRRAKAAAAAPEEPQGPIAEVQPLAIPEHYVGNLKKSSLPKPTSADFDKIKADKYRDIARELKDKIAHVWVVDPVPKREVDFPKELHPSLTAALQKQGYQRLYSHQLEAFSKVKQGKDVILTTPTSSGKSICFNLPVFDKLLKAPEATTALFLFPLNALALDQEKKLRDLNSKLPPQEQLSIATMTGDMNQVQRFAMFKDKPPHILITNPDLLHWHLKKCLEKNSYKHWLSFLTRLNFIVLDEAHTYQSVLGTNMTNLVRRLLVAAECAGNRPAKIRFILASATVGNARDMALKLTSRHDPEGYKLHWVSESGASVQERTFLCLTADNSALSTTTQIIELWIKTGIKGIVFCNTIDSLIKVVEKCKRPDLVRGYYAGQPIEQKKFTLDALKRHQVQVLVATSALEAGVDIAELDACLIKGYPGSKMSFWQRIGRAGRTRPGLVIFVPHSNDPLDFYYAEHPTQLLTGEVEKVAFDPNSTRALTLHLQCCVTELGEVPKALLENLFGPPSVPLIAKMLATQQFRPGKVNTALVLNKIDDPHKLVMFRGGDQNAGEPDKIQAVLHSSKPSVVFSKLETNTLNGARGKERFSIQSTTVEGSEQVIEQLSFTQAFNRLYPGAIFRHQDQDGHVHRYVVKDLNITAKKAYLAPCSANMAAMETMKFVSSQVTFLRKESEKWFSFVDHPEARLHLTFGTVKVKISLTGYQAKAGSYVNRVDYPIPFDHCYETTCLRFSMNEAAQKYWGPAIANSLRGLDQHLHGEGASAELKQRIELCRKASGAYVMLHSLIHQLQLLVPFELLSCNSSDIQEVGLDPDHCAAHLVDTNIGSGIVAKAIFDNFLHWVNKSIEFTTNCTGCLDAPGWGCSMCLFQSQCEKLNSPLLSGYGNKLMKLTEVVDPAQKEQLLQRSDSVQNLLQRSNSSGGLSNSTGLQRSTSASNLHRPASAPALQRSNSMTTVTTPSQLLPTSQLAGPSARPNAILDPFDDAIVDSQAGPNPKLLALSTPLSTPPPVAALPQVLVPSSQPEGTKLADDFDFGDDARFYSSQQ